MPHSDNIPWHWVMSGLDHRFAKDGQLQVKVKEGYEVGGIGGDGFEIQFTTTSTTWTDTGVKIPVRKGVHVDKRENSLVRRISKYSWIIQIIQLIVDVLKLIRISRLSAPSAPAVLKF